MASLVRIWIVSYRDVVGKKVKKGTRGAKKVRERSAKWYGQGTPGQPPKKRVPLAADKRAAQQMLADLVGDGERGVAGMPARDAAGQPLGPLVVEFSEAVRRKSGESHTLYVVGNVRRVLSTCRVATLADLNAADLAPRVEKYVWSLMGDPEQLAIATAAYRGKHVRQFTRWLWRKRKVLDHDPLAGMDLP